MQTLPPECVAHILSFLDTKSALLFSETSSLYNEIVFTHKHKVQDYVVEKKDEKSEILLTINMSGNMNFSETKKDTGVTRDIFGEIVPCLITTTKKGPLLKKERHGVWEETISKELVRYTGSLWLNGRLIYIHVQYDKSEYFASPVDDPAKDGFSWGGYTLRVSFWRRSDYNFRSCDEKQYPAFYEAVELSPFSHCCPKHWGELPAPLLPQVLH